jgi:hypothetical protein
MGDPYLDSLPTEVDRWSSSIPPGDPLRDVLLHVLLEAAWRNKGVTIGRATLPLAASEIVAASPRALELLGYPDVRAYAVAVRKHGFVYSGDVAVVEQHIRTKSPTAYDVSLLTGDGRGYQRLRLQGWTFNVDRTPYRVVLIWPP